MNTEHVDNSLAGRVRLLVLAEREVICAPNWPQVWSGAQCVLVSDLYAALTELVKGRGRFDGLVIDARRMTLQWAGAIGLIRKHVGVAVWLLDSAEGRPAVVAQAAEQGARIVGEETPVARHEEVEHFATSLLRLHNAPRSGANPVIREDMPKAEASASEPLRSEARGGRSLGDFTESAQNPVESQHAVHYHEVALQPVLTEEELRALLGPEP